MTSSTVQRIAEGRTDLVFVYIADGGAATDSHGGTSLIKWCAYYGDVSAIRFLLANGESVHSLGENLDLNGASFHGHWRLVQFLIEEGADVNHPLKGSLETPLHAALSKPNRPGYTLVVELLLGHGADANARTSDHSETGCFMRDVRTRGETPLHRAAAFGSARSIDALLEAGAAADALDVNGDSPLSWASWHQRPDAILKRLCYGDFSIHPQRDSRSDHGSGWSAMDLDLLGKPLP